MDTIDQATPTKRPDFLTVLCILTFVNVAYHVISGITTLVSMGNAEEEVAEAQYQMEEALSQSGDEMPGFLEGFLSGAMDMASLAAEHALTLGLGEILIFLAIGLGAFLMWNQQKKGFYLYLIANVVWLLFNPVVLEFNTWALYGSGVAFIFVAAFVAMYSANLKHMS